MAEVGRAVENKKTVESCLRSSYGFVMKIMFIALVMPLLLSACASQPQELKSPCVGAAGSPCDRRPANVV